MTKSLVLSFGEIFNMRYLQFYEPFSSFLRALQKFTRCISGMIRDANFVGSRNKRSCLAKRSPTENDVSLSKREAFLITSLASLRAVRECEYRN